MEYKCWSYKVADRDPLNIQGRNQLNQGRRYIVESNKIWWLEIGVILGIDPVLNKQPSVLLCSFVALQRFGRILVNTENTTDLVIFLLLAVEKEMATNGHESIEFLLEKEVLSSILLVAKIGIDLLLSSSKRFSKSKHCHGEMYGCSEKQCKQYGLLLLMLLFLLWSCCHVVLVEVEVVLFSGGAPACTSMVIRIWIQS